MTPYRLRTRYGYNRNHWTVLHVWFFFAFFAIKICGFFYQIKYCASCVHALPSQIFRIFIFLLLHLTFYILFGHCWLQLLAGVNLWNEIIVRNVSTARTNRCTSVDSSFFYLISLCSVSFGYIWCVCVPRNYCLYSFDSVIWFNCFFFMLFTW